MSKIGLYRGFSTFEYQRNKTFRLNDIQLVQLDLLNHIFTKRGSRVMMPSFGTVIPELVFEPLDEDTLDTLRDELETVFRYDPRVEQLSLTITPNYDTNTVTASANLLYVELQVADAFEFNIQFEN